MPWNRIVFALLSITMLSTGCGQKILGTNLANNRSGPDQDVGQDLNAAGRRNTGANLQRNVPTQSSNLVKSSHQLSAAVTACVGTGTAVVKTSMIIPTVSSTSAAAPPNPEAFLVVPGESAGKNFIELKRKDFDGEVSQTATSVRNATLTLSYLSALQSLANVVAVNCVSLPGNPSSPSANPTPSGGGTAALTVSSQCDCRTQEKAKAMLARCLPHLSEASRGSIEEEFAMACSLNPRRAVASLIGSAQFARFD